MKLSDYQRAAQRTMVGPSAAKSQEERMVNAALGLCGEAAEINNAVEYGPNHDVLEESGDLLWYVAQMCFSQGETIASIPPQRVAWSVDRAQRELWHHTGYIADAVKKLYFHQKPINVVVFFDSLQGITTAVAELLHIYGWSIADACEYNNAKLLKRFSEGFTPAAANARLDEATP